VRIDRVIETAKHSWNRIGDLLLAACCLLLSLALYVTTLAPSVPTLFDDSLEFPLVAYRLAIAHPTGYPLYTLLAKLFTLGPWHNVAWAVNLLSAVAGALAVALAFLVARQLTRRRWPALLGAAALAVSPVFWSQAAVAEVYTLNTVFVAGLLWLALRWAQRPLVPVEPFALLLAAPRGRQPIFLPRQGLWLHLPPPIRQAAHRLHAFSRRLFPAVPPRRRLQLHPLAYALAFVLGLSQAHHRTALLVVPALLAFALLVERRVLSRAALLGPEHPERRRWLQFAGRPLVLLTACFLLPLLLYLYLPLRSHVGSLDGTYAEVGFWRWVTASGYGAFLSDNPLARDLGAAFYGKLFWQQFGPVGLALALVGLIDLVRRPKALVLTGLAFLSYVAFAVVYRVPDVEVFFMPAFLLAAIWIAIGLDQAMDLLRIRGPSLALRRLLAVCSLLLVASAVFQPSFIAARNYPDIDLSRRWIVHDYGQYVLNQDLPYGNSTIVGLGGEMNLLRYFQDTTGLRRDVQTVIADEEAARREAVDAAQVRGRTVYLTHPWPGLAAGHSLGGVIGPIDVAGDLEMLLGVDAPAGQLTPLPPGTKLEPIRGLELVGAEIHEHQEHWQAWAQLRLWWRTPEGLGERLKVSARLVEAGGRVISAVDAEPVGGAYPTTDWQPGEVVADVYEIPLPAGTPPGAYVPVIVVYDPNPESGGERGRIELSPVLLNGNPARPPRRALETSVAETLYARFGDVELLGFTPPDPQVAYRPGEVLPPTLLWQTQKPPAGDWQVAFWLENTEVYSLGIEPVGGPFSTVQWSDGQVVRQWPALRVPAGIPPGTYRLRIRVTRDGQPVPWGRWLIPLGSDLELGTVRIAG
jgi:hypothetical protein